MAKEPIIYGDDVFIIAEVGNNHEGDFALAQDLVGLAAEAGVDAVKFQTIVPEFFVNRSEKIRGKDELLRIERNLETLIETRKRLNSKLPVIRLCFCVQKDNIHEQRAFLDKWRDRVDYIDFQEMVDFGEVDAFRAMGDDAAVPADLPVPASTYCAYPFNSLHVWSNGDVTPCCTFFGKALTIGNTKNDTLLDIWNGGELAEIRRQLQTGELNKVCHACLTSRDTENFAKAGSAANEGKAPAHEMTPAE